MTLKLEDIVGQGIYTIPEAAKLTDVPAANVYNWLYGGSAKGASSNTRKRATLAHQYRLIDQVANVSFNDLIQIRFVSFFRDQGVSLQAIRKAVRNASRLLSTTHPLCSAQFKTDGENLLAEVVEHNGETNLVELHTMQQVFRELIDPFLKSLEYDTDHVSKWWHSLGDHRVVLDPRCNFGKPTVARCGLPTEALFEAYLANAKSVKTVADWFEVEEDDVASAVDFELRLAA